MSKYVSINCKNNTIFTIFTSQLFRHVSLDVFSVGSRCSRNAVQLVYGQVTPPRREQDKHQKKLSVKLQTLGSP